MNQSIPQRNEILLEAIRSAEETALQLRSYAAATMRVPNECTYESEQPYLPVQVEVTLEGWVPKGEIPVSAALQMQGFSLSRQNNLFEI